GRFVSADTEQGNAQGLDPYAYVKGNPETMTDPTGKKVCGPEPTCGPDGGPPPKKDPPKKDPPPDGGGCQKSCETESPPGRTDDPQTGQPAPKPKCEKACQAAAVATNAQQQLAGLKGRLQSMLGFLEWIKMITELLAAGADIGAFLSGGALLPAGVAMSALVAIMITGNM
ncbi:MAG: hypothetical protein J2P36_36195, partial [Ktedonobacteraceae bacterium]|nr:hypothetical protein [Ktedonobacteraceae bacterium]